MTLGVFLYLVYPAAVEKRQCYLIGRVAPRWDFVGPLVFHGVLRVLRDASGYNTGW